MCKRVTLARFIGERAAEGVEYNRRAGAPATSSLPA
jgi:hypothetical protein